MIAIADQKTIHVCDECGLTRETDKPRLPRGWKRIGGSIRCDDCYASAVRCEREGSGSKVQG